MDRYTLIVVADERSPVRRFQISKRVVARALAAAGVLALLFAAASWDYWRMRAEHAELLDLRIENAEQREQVASVEHKIKRAETELARVQELERKVRIIANLPGATAIGGEGVTDLLPQEVHDGTGAAGLALPVGVPSVPAETLSGAASADQDVPLSSLLDDRMQDLALSSPPARRVFRLGTQVERMSRIAAQRADSMDLLLDQLDDKRVKLASMPSIWPTRGWLTSRFGARVSPFTGRTQLHAGIDIAGREGTLIVAPAQARVRYVGRKGPLGNALVLDHGFGVRTVYGHTEKIFVKPGQVVERGQRIASMGSSGRSTGPHLHYVVEVKGKPRDPLDYIFD